MRLEANAAIVQFTVETFDVRFDERTFDANGKIADASVKQSLIGDQTPLESRWHKSDCSYFGSRTLEFFDLLANLRYYLQALAIILRGFVQR